MLVPHYGCLFKSVSHLGLIYFVSIASISLYYPFLTSVSQMHMLFLVDTILSSILPPNITYPQKAIRVGGASR
jgi:hypothetical protein